MQARALAPLLPQRLPCRLTPLDRGENPSPGGIKKQPLLPWTLSRLCPNFLPHLLSLLSPAPAAAIAGDTRVVYSLTRTKSSTTSDVSQQSDIRCFFIQDRVESGDIKVEYLNTKSMVADYLTKPLVGELFYKLRDLLLGYTTL